MNEIMQNKIVPPAVELIKRFLHLFFLFDTSWSMEGKRIGTANQAMREVFAVLPDLIKNNPEVQLLIRCISFSNKARWHMGPDPVGVESLTWKDLSARGSTSTGAAIKMLADTIVMNNMPEKGIPPVMILVSDGDNTDGSAYEKAIEALEKEPWGTKAVRLAIGIGDSYDKAKLEKFSNHPEVGVLEAKTAVDLISYIKFASTVAAQSSIHSVPDALSPNNNVQLPPPPTPAKASSNVKLEVL